MRIAVFSAQSHDRHYLRSAVAEGNDRHSLEFFESRLQATTAPLADGFNAVCPFVNDDLSAPVLEALAGCGVRLVAMRCAGFNNVDLEAAARLRIPVVRVPAYSPHAVAEHAIGLILALNRKLPRAYNRVRDGNFSLEGLLGFDLCGQTAGIVGAGQIGAVAAKILHGFGCRILLYDVREVDELRTIGDFVPLDELFRRSDIISLHCPLIPATRRMINEQSLELMKPGVMLINTSRGGLIDTRAVIEALKTGQVGALGLDVYEEEESLFFQDRSGEIIRDDVFTRLLTFPNVMVTAHQAFFTRNALQAIARTTVASLDAFERGEPLTCEVKFDPRHPKHEPRAAKGSA